MFFPKQVMMIFNRSIGISISLKSRILSYYFQIQNFILKTLPDVKYEKSSHSIIYFNVNPCSHRFSRPIFISFLYNLHSPPTFKAYCFQGKIKVENGKLNSGQILTANQNISVVLGKVSLNIQKELEPVWVRKQYALN